VLPVTNLIHVSSAAAGDTQKLKDPHIYIPPLTGKLEQQQFTM